MVKEISVFIPFFDNICVSFPPQLHAKYEHAPKHKRNLVITGGVTASVLFSPILAGLAVGESSRLGKRK